MCTNIQYKYNSGYLLHTVSSSIFNQYSKLEIKEHDYNPSAICVILFQNCLTTYFCRYIDKPLLCDILSKWSHLNGHASHRHHQAYANLPLLTTCKSSTSSILFFFICKWSHLNAHESHPHHDAHATLASRPYNHFFQQQIIELKCHKTI